MLNRNILPILFHIKEPFHFNILMKKSAYHSPFLTYQKPLDGILGLYYMVPYD